MRLPLSTKRARGADRTAASSAGGDRLDGVGKGAGRSGPARLLPVDPSAAQGERDELDLAVDFQPAKGVLDVIADGRVGEVQTGRDVEGGITVGEERDDLVLAPGERA